MNVHYINILLFSFPLNILVNTHKKNTFNTHHTQTNRSLCECELYAPVNYDNDPEMKSVMDYFERQSSQRFHEYDERMKSTRQKCKEQCDKQIQKIILKDKLEKELMDKFAMLQTDIQSDAIPTCVCEKSLADKVEKGCLRCTQNLGGILAPSSGVLAGIAEGALSVWKPAALKAAAKYAMKEGLAFGKIIGEAKGKEVIIGALETNLSICKLNGIPLKSFFRLTPYNDVKTIASAIDTEMTASCGEAVTGGNQALCRVRETLNSVAQRSGTLLDQKAVITKGVNEFVEKAEEAATLVKNSTTKEVADIIKRQQTSEIAATYMVNQTAIIASIVAIVVIVLIMVIIYLILRYRRKKKMKKKLQYIKLLEE
ncbi:rifin PIR protein, putative [Plasmodium reichenowi]|uniref:Rifin PIR protein, putative n=1 Tax=Plasmodium reichenowi TaxID=5854 RepID=A0A2P9DU35_PLARE|nr:rifin PIR protein, putative [Plasmodium reichenowi]